MKLFRMQRMAAYALVMILSLIIAACGNGNSGNPNQKLTESAAVANSTLASPTPGMSGSLSFTPPPTATPTFALTTTSTPTSTPSPTPHPVQIAMDNLYRIRLVEEIGKKNPVGKIYGISVSSDGKNALIFGETVMVYTFESKKQVFFEGEFSQAALSPNGSRLALASSDQTIEILALEEDQSQTQLQGRFNSVKALAWSPDGERIAGYDLEAGLMVWDPSNGELLKVLSFPVEEHPMVDQIHLKWSPDSQLVGLVGVDQNVRIVAGDELITLKGFDRPVTHLDWSPDGTRLAGSSAHAPTVIVWRTSNWNQIASIGNHQYWVSNVAWSPDGKYLATADASGTAFIRDPNNGTIIHYFPNLNSPDLIAWSPDGSHLLELFWDEFKVYNVGTKKSIEVPEAVFGGVESISWIPGSQRLLLTNTDSRVQHWDLVSGEVEMLINPDVGNIVALAWAPDGNRLALGERGGGILLYDHAQKSLVKVAKRTYPLISALSWSPDGAALSVAPSWGSSAIIDPATGEEQLSFGDNSASLFQDWSHPGDFILTGHRWSGEISLWDPKTGKLVGEWNPIEDNIRQVSFSPDYAQALILTNQSITVWDVTSGKMIKSRQFDMDTWLDASQWSPDGSQIALVVTDLGDLGMPLNSIHYLDAETLDDTQVFEFEVEPFYMSTSSDLSWSPDGSLLALSSGEIRDGQTSALLQTMEETGRMTWSPDGYSLIIISSNLEIWQVNSVTP